MSLMSPALAGGFFIAITIWEAQRTVVAEVNSFFFFLTHRSEYTFLPAMVLMWEFEFIQSEVGMSLRFIVAMVTLTTPEIANFFSDPL